MYVVQVYLQCIGVCLQLFDTVAEMLSLKQYSLSRSTYWTGAVDLHNLVLPLFRLKEKVL